MRSDLWGFGLLHSFKGECCQVVGMMVDDTEDRILFLCLQVLGDSVGILHRIQVTHRKANAAFFK
jgi:hypothetical protein